MPVHHRRGRDRGRHRVRHEAGQPVRERRLRTGDHPARAARRGARREEPCARPVVPVGRRRLRQHRAQARPRRHAAPRRRRPRPRDRPRLRAARAVRLVAVRRRLQPDLGPRRAVHHRQRRRPRRHRAVHHGPAGRPRRDGLLPRLLMGYADRQPRPAHEDPGHGQPQGRAAADGQLPGHG